MYICWYLAVVDDCSYFVEKFYRVQHWALNKILFVLYLLIVDSLILEGELCSLGTVIRIMYVHSLNTVESWELFRLLELFRSLGVCAHSCVALIVKRWRLYCPLMACYSFIIEKLLFSWASIAIFFVWLLLMLRDGAENYSVLLIALNSFLV